MTLPPYLFWDTDLSTLDFQEHARFVIQRVIQKGSINDWITIKRFYGLPLIKQEILQMRTLDTKTLHFFSVYFNIPKSKFRCYITQQSTPKHYSY